MLAISAARLYRCRLEVDVRLTVAEREVDRRAVIVTMSTIGQGNDPSTRIDWHEVGQHGEAS